jgi:hypothetical protein
MSTFNSSCDARNGTAPGPSAWETFLLSAGVPESSCASLVAGGTRKGCSIRSWVRENYTRRYVPEAILETLGPRKELMHSWQEEERQRVLYVAKGAAY